MLAGPSLTYRIMIGSFKSAARFTFKFSNKPILYDVRYQTTVRKNAS